MNKEKEKKYRGLLKCNKKKNNRLDIRDKELMKTKSKLNQRL